ncbi:MAG: GIY-YIG nuclease family protein [Candidatus Omnitrophica bacterium]|nr:GIY-YIG nuclease family protein [Candidatus Omnitrophota bacterium]
MKRKIRRRNHYCVYLVTCKNGTYYAGYTANLERRLREHNAGKRGAKYVRGKGPVCLVWYKEYRYLHYAMSAEHRIKRLTRLEKEKLINGMRFDKVLALAGK